MDIVVNNNKEHFKADKISVSELLALKNYTFKMLVIRINNHLVPKDQYATAEIRDGDDVMVLHLISGG